MSDPFFHRIAGASALLVHRGVFREVAVFRHNSTGELFAPWGKGGYIRLGRDVTSVGGIECRELHVPDKYEVNALGRFIIK